MTEEPNGELFFYEGEHARHDENIIVGKTLDLAAAFLSKMGPMSVPFENSNKKTKAKVIEALKKCYSKYLTPKGVEFHFSTWIVSAYNH